MELKQTICDECKNPINIEWCVRNPNKDSMPVAYSVSVIRRDSFIDCTTRHFCDKECLIKWAHKQF
jgi:hypothetical protein